MTDELKRFYNLVESNKKFNDLVFKTDDISWVVIYDNEANDLHLGVSQNGEWILKHIRNIYVLDEKKKFLYCSNLLEVPFEKIKMKLEERFRDVIQEENINIITIFPFYQIVEFSLNNLLNDYWFDLAMLWFDELEPSMRSDLKETLKNILDIKRISQKNRQRARKTIKKLELVN